MGILTCFLRQNIILRHSLPNSPTVQRIQAYRLEWSADSQPDPNGNVLDKYRSRLWRYGSDQPLKCLDASSYTMATLLQPG
jgi:hypothetical protein